MLVSVAGADGRYYVHLDVVIMGRIYQSQISLLGVPDQ